MNFFLGIIIIYAKLLHPWIINVEIVANSVIKTNIKQLRLMAFILIFPFYSLLH